MLMSNCHSNIKFRCKITVLVFTLPGTVVLLLIELTSAIWRQKYWHQILQKNISEKVSPLPISFHRYLCQYSKSVAATVVAISIPPWLGY